MKLEDIKWAFEWRYRTVRRGVVSFVDNYLTPKSVKLLRKRTAWMETLLHGGPERYQHFYEKFGNFSGVWADYLMGAAKDAERQINNWMLNDLFDTAIIGQLNDDNLLRHLFKTHPAKFVGRKWKVQKKKKRK